MTPATRAWEAITAYCGCGRILANPTSQPRQALETVTCACGQANVAQFWRQQPAPQQYWTAEDFKRCQPAVFHELP